jgi:maleate isomerase
MDWKCQLGIIVPSWNTMMEYECSRIAPAGVSIHSTRISHRVRSVEARLHMVEVAPEAAELLAHAKVKAICFGCTGASFVKLGIDQEIIKTMEAATKTPCTTTTTAIIEALHRLKAKSVAISSPYDEENNKRMINFLEYSGFKAVSQKGLNMECPSYLSPDHAYRVAREANRPEADVVIISCTNFRSLEVIDQLEKDLGKPVVSSNTASMWKLLQLAGVGDKITGAGQLFNLSE